MFGFYCRLFTIALESGRNITVNVHTFANIPMIEIKEDVENFKGTKPHWVEASDWYVVISIKDENNVQVSVPMFTAFHRPLQYYIDAYYDKIINGLLKDAKVIECELLLSELDIQEFRKVENDTSGYFIPVYIEYYGKFFYVNKISNFGASPIAKVELVKL